MADEKVCIGPAQSIQSYLNVDAILDAIQTTKSEAVIYFKYRIKHLFFSIIDFFGLVAHKRFIQDMVTKRLTMSRIICIVFKE